MERTVKPATKTQEGEKPKTTDEILTEIRKVLGQIDQDLSKFRKESPCTLLDLASHHINDAIKVLETKRQDREERGVLDTDKE